jgi:RNA polymerase subunit RPABC4/transcription elongation factor Spt4
MTPETCPNCGADVPRGARSCPDCGADEQTGWSERADADRLGISDPDDFDHGEFVRREFGRGGPGRRPAWVWVAAVILLLALLAWWVF